MPIPGENEMQYDFSVVFSASRIKTENEYDRYILCITLKSNFVAEASKEISVLLRTMVRGGMKKIIVDIRDLEYIDSSGIGILIQTTKLLRAKGGDLILLNTPDKIHEIFKLVHLNDFIHKYQFKQKAIDYLFSLNS